MTFTVFLDRDGVFNVHSERGIVKPSQFTWLPGAREAFARLNRDDVQTCLCTNQPRVGLGLATPRMVRRMNGLLADGLAEAGGRLDHAEAAFAAWPHRRRKPRPGMLEDGAAWLDKHRAPVDKARAVMVGDKPKDAMAGNAFGVPAILLATTYSKEKLAEAVSKHGIDAIIVADLPAAVDEILRRLDKA